MKSDYFAIFFFPTITVSTKGTTTATTIAIANVNMYCGMMERIPGRPPTPIAVAVEFVATEITAAHAEPIIAQMNG